MLSGIYPVGPVGTKGPHLSDSEAALLETLPQEARASRLATHSELRAAIMAMAERHDHSLMLEATDFGFTAMVAGELRVVAHTRGTGEQTFYCQVENDALLRELAEEIARACGPQLMLPVSGDSDGVLVVARPQS